MRQGHLYLVWSPKTHVARAIAQHVHTLLRDICARFKARAPLAALAVIGSLCLSSAPAHAQTTSEARTVLVGPLSLAKLTDMDFGNLFVTSAGTVVMTAQEVATCTTTGGIVHTEECQPATFAGLGQTGQRVRIRRPVGRTITLTGPGEDMLVEDITINAGNTLTPVRSNPNWERFRIATANGSFVFWVGGTLNVNANQLPGLYTGTFDIRIDYQ